MRVWVTLMVLLYTVLCFKPGTASLIRIKGNYTIIALLPVHSKQCSNELNLKAAVQSQALAYAVEKVNSDRDVLGDMSLGFEIEDVCYEQPEKLLDAMNTLFKRYKNQAPTAFLIDLSDVLTPLVVHKFQNIPVFSFGSRASKHAFSLEADKPRLGQALTKLVQQLNWTVFDVLVANSSDYEVFKEASKTSKACQNRVGYISEKSQKFGKEMYPLLVLSDSLQIVKKLQPELKGRDVVIASEFLEMDERFPKTLAVRQQVENLDDFGEFWRSPLNVMIAGLGRIVRDSAQFQECTLPGNESCLSEITGKLSEEVRYGGKVIDAVYTIAHALKSTKSRPLTNDGIISMPEFTSPTGREISFSQSKGLSKVEYSVYYLAKTPAAAVGSLQTSPTKTTAELSLDGLEFNRDSPSCLATCPEGLTPVPTSEKCCVKCVKQNSTGCEKGLRLSKDGVTCVKPRLDYLRWDHPLSIVIFIIVILLFCFLLYLVNIYHKKGQTSTILTSRLATLPLLLALFVTLIHPLLPIIKPGSSSCNAYVFGFVQALGIPLCIMISRSNSYSKRFRNEDGSLKRKIVHTNPQNLIAVFLILFQIILSIIFIAICSAHVVYYETADPYVDYIECSTFSGGEFLFPFFYTIILSLFFTVKNFGAVTQEEDTYESHFTAISLFAFYFLSFLNIILVYSISGKVKIMLICIVGVLHMLNFLCFIFLPKMYKIILQRDPIRFSPFPLTSGERQVLIFDLTEKTIEIKGGPP